MAGKIPSSVELQLLTLVEKERSGFEVAELLERENGTKVSPGTLYTTFRRMREAGWVSVREGVDEDGRVRHFKITAIGARALASGRNYYLELSKFGRGLRAQCAETGGGSDLV